MASCVTRLASIAQALWTLALRICHVMHDLNETNCTINERSIYSFHLTTTQCNIVVVLVSVT
jgi:hypothetical protein